MSEYRVAATDTVSHALGPVADDWAAVDVWFGRLELAGASAATLATYRREIRRVQWYHDHVAAVPLSRWTYQDADAYVTFLKEVAPSHICPTGAKRGSTSWTPFRRALSATSIADARKVLNTLYSFWQSAGYTRSNPLAGIGGRRKPTAPTRRAIRSDLFDATIGCMESREKKSARDYLIFHRNRFLLLLLARTGLRANEAAQGSMTDIELIPDPANNAQYWALNVSAQKGGGIGNVFLDDIVMEALETYRLSFGLPRYPHGEERYGLILSPYTTRTNYASETPRSKRQRKAWRSVRSRQTIWQIIKTEFQSAAEFMNSAGKHAEARQLEAASTHWLRHSFGTRLVLENQDLRLVAKAMRHKNINTTMSYTNLELLDIARALAPFGTTEDGGEASER